MMNNWNESIKLVSYSETKDSDGFSIPSSTETNPIPANFKNITRAVEEHSKVMGYNANLVVEIMECNYNGQSYLIDVQTSKKYEIKRTFKITSEVLELTCSDVSKSKK
ncbi:MAG: hypothetical protein MJ200_05390 [Mycoplasmoidaceae bacterium]|nr:hypothetical protein [Mycoplasmoidaceae bacterium]